MKIYSFVLLLALNITACSLFETRTPEEPDGSSGTFVPPSTPSIVLDNLIDAFNHKNLNNYIACMSVTRFNFTPDGNINASYPSLFDNWNVNNENQYFNATISAMNKESMPILILKNRDFDHISQDSAVLITEYSITCEFQEIGLTKNFIGKSVFTMIPEPSGLWAISGWQDFQISSDTNNSAWSNLKAYFGH